MPRHSQPRPCDVPGYSRWSDPDPENPAEVDDPSERDESVDEIVCEAAQMVAAMAYVLRADQRELGHREGSRARSRRELAQKTGLSEGTLRNIEEGTTWPSLLVWERLKSLLGSPYRQRLQEIAPPQ